MAKSRRVLPGFGLSLGYTVVYLSILVLIPFSGLLLKTFAGGWEHFFKTITEPRVVASYYVSFGISLVAALINGCLLYTSPSPRDLSTSRMPSSA